MTLILLVAVSSCKNDPTPKPKGQLRLDYPEALYKPLLSTCPYTFEKNYIAEIEVPRNKRNCWINLNYPQLKGKIYLTYHPVNNNLNALLTDVQKATQEHTQKADLIGSRPYENAKQRAYGMVYEVEGNAASPLQFYLTDSTSHFLSGSVYFYAKPNYDSILPAAHYIKKDVIKLIESLQWQNIANDTE